MDEGFNTFIDVYESDDFDGGVSAPSATPNMRPGGGNPVDEILPLLDDPEAPDHADARRCDYARISATRSPTSNPRCGLVLLREQILGPERFDWAFPQIHPRLGLQTSLAVRFFPRHGERRRRGSGLVLARLVHEQLDPRSGRPGCELPGRGRAVTISNRGKLVLPRMVQVTFKDGTSSRLQLPAETWIQKTAYTLHFDKQPIAVIIDPDHAIPDSDRSNNEWKSAGDGSSDR